MVDAPLDADDPKMARVRQAVATVLSDFERTTTRTTSVKVSRHTFDESVPLEILIAVDGGWDTGGYSTELEGEELIADVADYLQGEWMTQRPWRVWPVCEGHGVGLHAEVHEGRAVWWCRVGHHAPARVGELGVSA